MNDGERQEGTVRPDFTLSPQLYPFQSRWLPTSAGDVHHVDEGQGRPFLFSTATRRGASGTGT